MAQFGVLVTEHRQRLGLSNARVAELVGRAPGTIRAWERGRSVPDDPVVVTSLAAVLGIEESALFQAAGMEPPGEATPFSLEETLSSIAPGSVETAPVEVPAPQPVPGRHAVSSDQRKLDARETAMEKLRSAVDSVSESVSGGWRKRLKALRQPAQRSVQPPGQRPVTPPRVVARGSNTRRSRSFRSLSYMEDVEQRWSYRMRAILTGAGVAVMGLVLLWAASGLFGAVGDLWDALTAGL